MNGTITNMDLRPGDYVAAGKGVFALVDSDTIRVEGYFEETKLERMAPGDRVTVQLMGMPTLLNGHIQRRRRRHRRPGAHGLRRHAGQREPDL